MASQSSNEGFFLNSHSFDVTLLLVTFPSFRSPPRPRQLPLKSLFWMSSQIFNDFSYIFFLSFSFCSYILKFSFLSSKFVLAHSSYIFFTKYLLLSSNFHCHLCTDLWVKLHEKSQLSSEFNPMYSPST